MSDISTETQVAKKFDPEAFAMNLARAMENSGRALSAYLKPREGGEAKDKPPNELTEVIKTFSAVAEYWLSDKERSAELQMKIGKAYLDLWGSSMRRLLGEPGDVRALVRICQGGARPGLEPAHSASATIVARWAIRRPAPVRDARPSICMTQPGSALATVVAAIVAADASLSSAMAVETSG